tara:strand:- start:1244 stop:1912 length:669 start_codon:yes stop_codon:yes gene_type:complete
MCFSSLLLCALTVASPPVSAALLPSGDTLDGDGSPDDEDSSASESQPETEQTDTAPEPPWWSAEAVELRNERRKTERSSKAESGDRTDSNGVYVEATSLLFFNAVVVNAERWIGKQTAISMGIGRSTKTWFDGIEQATGPRVQVHGFLGPNARFEVAGGVAVDREESMYERSDEVSVAYTATPTIYAGFRRQPEAGGFVFRVGVGWVHTHTFGPSISLGVAF